MSTGHSGAVVSQALHRTGILLVNLGTPDAPEPAAVRRYLREFLSDPRVIDINPVGRWLLLNLVILPFRPKRSAAAYEKIWTEAGSPLLTHSLALVDALRERIPACPIELGMRYGSPSIESGLTRLRERSCDQIVVVPLYPHYASSSTGSSVEKVYRTAAKLWNTPYITIVPPFYEHPAFISAFTEVARAKLESLAPDHVLFSFHGLPERQVIASADPKLCVVQPDCCEQLVDGNRNCYRAQCFATARALARALDLGPDHGVERRWSISFQSRLGRTPWIKPYTDEVVPALAQRGVRRLAVMCPAFVADCLETIEEIGMRAREDFTAAGGETLELIPSLNSTPAWVVAVEKMITEQLPRPRSA
ncbi:Ferrochelatase, protoheme ferro-lyase [Enhygromyxa salina]|uniref:Ferrochelatase n=1 Tax=Enhygromyxa salina TaxID=215803 RepID=A0A0C2D6F8_9BACT|nr:Ferrochelatase, protoheme ferro-lyase [Enhygromyxa salina]